MQKFPRAEITTRVAEALDMVRMSDFADRRPHQLSGGQQQRIALARALVNKPSVLLLDEPLGALDLKLRKAMQLELKQVQQDVGITFIYVTHDQEEALTMSDRIAVMSHGSVIQCATPREIYERPMTRYVADFIGETNFLHGQITSQNGVAEVLIDGQTPILAAASEPPLPVGENVTVAIRPEKINIQALGGDYRASPNGNGQAGPAALKADGRTCVVRGTVRDSIYIGTDTRYIVQLNDKTQLVARIQNFGEGFDQRIDRGAPVLAHWAADNARILLD
jgi:spermidine/putrescine transport system ATP-binding protein